MLAGATPTIVFEQGDKRFDALSYEPVDKALSGLPARLELANGRQALDALFSWRDSSNLMPKQQALLQVFGIEAETQLMQFTDGNVVAYVRLNEADVKQWLSLLNVN
ncbi:hypothetical protein [Rheinheimera sp.]|uniref:hypothetical protein n=1 Tax=Rheinheimera sp. TaxID=1869214 RepID=UPI0040481918